MVKLTGTFSKLKPFKALVVGDFMLDKYTTGYVKRISPEAPVSVLTVTKEEYLPGGAGNVALNLIALGASVFSLGRVGSDSMGIILKEKLIHENINIANIFTQDAYITPLKNRLLANGQQLLRVDQEMTCSIPDNFIDELLPSLDQVLSQIDVIAVSDYNKGFLTRNLLKILIKKARERKIPIIVDPKGDDYTRYRGVDIIKPNLKEAYQAVSAPLHTPLKDIVAKLKNLTDAKHLLITMSENGIALFDENLSQRNFPVRAKAIKDVTGAGDTVLSILCAAMANKMDIDHAVQFANIAAGIAIEKIGCSKVSLSELASRLLEQDVGNKIFDDSHMFVLKKILEDFEYAILSIDDLKIITAELFTEIRSLAKKYKKLIIFIKDRNPDDNAIDLLSSLHEVDYIILKSKTIKKTLQDILKTKHYFNYNLVEKRLIS